VKFFRKKPRLLLVDDNLSLASGLKRFFEHRGLPTDTVHSGDQLRKAFANPAPCAVVLDIRLGDVDGLDLIPEIKEAWPSTPVIIITGSGYNDEQMQKAQDAGAAGYVSKSVPPDEVLAAITRVLEHPEHHQSS